MSSAPTSRQAAAHYVGLGVRIDRVMTDNGSGYVSNAFRSACAQLGPPHPYSALHAQDQR